MARTVVEHPRRIPLGMAKIKQKQTELMKVQEKRHEKFGYPAVSETWELQLLRS